MPAVSPLQKQMSQQRQQLHLQQQALKVQMVVLERKALAQQILAEMVRACRAVRNVTYGTGAGGRRKHYRSRSQTRGNNRAPPSSCVSGSRFITNQASFLTTQHR